MNLTEIGYFSKTHGVKGHILLNSNRDFYFEETNALFVESGGSKAPYFIKEANELKNALVFLLEEVDSVEKAKLLIGKKVFIEDKFLAEEEGNEDWLGFELIDKNYGSLGKILDLSDNGQQVIASVIFKNKELILPLVDEMIDRIDEKEKKIFYEAPDGLIDVYLNEK